VNGSPSISDSLSGALDRRAALLEAVADAKQAEHVATISGTLQEQYAAGWAVTEAVGAVDDHDLQLATAILLGLRIAARDFPDVLRDTLAAVIGKAGAK
jgi:hypothetical protein